MEFNDDHPILTHFRNFKKMKDSSKTGVSKIIVELSGVEHKLTLEQAKKLFQALDDLFGTEKVEYRPYYEKPYWCWYETGKYPLRPRFSEYRSNSNILKDGHEIKSLGMKTEGVSSTMRINLDGD